MNFRSSTPRQEEILLTLPPARARHPAFLQHQPWSGMESQLPTYDRGSIGVLSAMLTPSLDIYDRFYSAQLMVEMAKASISLERHYLKHGQYPVRLKDLVPEFRDTVPLDPMSGQPFHYRKLGNDGFEFYSVGWNGKDDSGPRRRRHKG